jgi:hypothetical protein
MWTSYFKVYNNPRGLGILEMPSTFGLGFFALFPHLFIILSFQLTCSFKTTNGRHTSVSPFSIGFLKNRTKHHAPFYRAKT